MKSQLRLVVEMSSKQAAVKNIFGLIPIEGKFPKDSAYRVLVLVEERDFAGALKSLCTIVGGQSTEEFAMMTRRRNKGSKVEESAVGTSAASGRASI